MDKQPPGLLRHLRRRCNLGASDAAAFLGVSDRTYRRYENDHNYPIMVIKLMQYRAGMVPLDGWQGFTFEAGRLWTPQNECVQAAEINQFRWLLRELANRSEKTTFWQRVFSG